MLSKILAGVLALGLLPAVGSVAASTPVVENPSIYFTRQGAGGPASNSLVFEDPRGNHHQKPLLTDPAGRATSEFDRYLRKLGTRAASFYLILPHRTDRWSLSVATSEGPQSSEIFRAGQEHSQRNYRRIDLLKKVGVYVPSQWGKVDGRPCLMAEPTPEVGVIRMRTRSVSGEPIRNQPVQLFARDLGLGFTSRETIVWSGRTDTDGQIEIQQFPGVSDWVIHFPGMGHTKSGAVVVDPGSLTTIELNRIVPFGAISGRLDERLLGSVTGKSRVYLYTDKAWRYREAAIDPEGRFQITGVVADGRYAVQLRNGNAKPSGFIQSNVTVLVPGRRLEGVIVKPSLSEVAGGDDGGEWLAGGNAVEDEKKPALSGRVVDSAGKGVAGVTVYATMKFHGGVRMYQVTKEATTNARGEYEIANAEFKFGSVALVAHAPGRPLAIGAGGYWGPTEDTSVLVGVGGAAIGSEPKGPLSDVLQQPDLVLPDVDQGGELRVITLKKGVPHAGTLVRLELTDFHSSFSPGWAAGRMPEALNEVLTPTLRTGPKGEALFKRLTPGTYRVIADSSKEAEQSGKAHSVGWGPIPATVATGVPVASGHSRSVRLFVTDHHQAEVRFQVRHPGKSWRDGAGCAVSWSSSVTGRGRNSGRRLDPEGNGAVAVEHQGLWSLGVRYLTPDLGARQVPVRLEPSYAGSLQVAVSRLAPRKSPVVFRPRLIAPAKITADVFDEIGRPAPATVMLDTSRYGSFSNSKSRSASTDEAGHVHFERIQSGRHALSAVSLDWVASRVTLETPDSELEGRFGVPYQFVEAAPGEEVSVRLRRRPVAYIRGRVTPPPPQDIPVFLDLADARWLRPLDTYCHFSRETGDYLIGPVLPGEHTLRIDTYRDNNGELEFSLLHTLSVNQSGVHREDIPYRLKPVVAPAEGFQERGCGVVYEPDGKTPAYGARVALYVPGSENPRAVTWTGAKGEFRMAPLSQRFAGKPDKDDTFQTPILVTWLPGDIGATVTRLPISRDNNDDARKELKIILPESASVRGVVTVGGESLLGMPALVRVLARHRGLGKLDSILSMETTAGADGTFELRGLTPGSYELQAALDGIWLSGFQRITVPKGEAWSETIDLDIQPPGDIALYRLVNADGGAMANQPVRLLAPALKGPLGKRLRAATIDTDKAGILHLEGMSAGKQKIEVGNPPSRVEIEVPPLGAAMSTPAKVRVGD